MAFDFLKRNKDKIDKNKSESDNEGNFWENYVSYSENLMKLNKNLEIEEIIKQKEFRIPFNDIKRNRKDFDFLKNIIKNDTDLHRRTAALYFLFIFSKYDGTLNTFLRRISIELNLSSEDTNDIRHDLAELLRAKGDAAIMI